VLRHESEINGYAIQATDGAIGKVSDFLFDDSTWLVRWLVVDTGNWLPGRKVLIPPSALGSVNHIGHQFPVRLTRQQVKDCPDTDTNQPVSRIMETDIYDYYGWSPYWGGTACLGAVGIEGGYMGGSMASLEIAGSMKRQSEIREAQRKAGDPNLRSSAAITGYHVHASDGEIGHIDDFLVEDEDWSIHYLVVDTKNWWPGKKVLISPLSVRTIDWPSRRVNLGADRQKVRDSPAYDPAMTNDPIYQTAFHKHYGDLRLGMYEKAADPVVARQLGNIKPLGMVDEPHLVTPGVGNQVPGQTTHE
jgi:PRC-barrel domain protein